MASNTLTFVLSYRDPWYGRWRALMEAGRLSGRPVQVIQNTRSGPGRYWQTASRLLRQIEKNTVYILGFRGFEFYWLLRFLVGSQPIVLDALVSPTLSLASEKGSGLLRSFLPVFSWFEQKIYDDAEAILVDTESHRRALTETFSVPSKKIHVHPVGAEEKIFHPRVHECFEHNTAPFTVLYYFSGQKLHGEDQLVELIQKSRDWGVHFLLVGPNARSFSRYTNVTAFPFVPYRLLPTLIGRADLCLVGPFGDTPQAQKVITTKSFQCLASKKPVVLGKNRETRKYFRDKQNALLVPLNNEQQLERAIHWAVRHPRELTRIAKSGFSTYKKHFSSQKRSQQLEKVLRYV